MWQLFFQSSFFLLLHHVPCIIRRLWVNNANYLTHKNKKTFDTIHEILGVLHAFTFSHEYLLHI